MKLKPWSDELEVSFRIFRISSSLGVIRGTIAMVPFWVHFAIVFWPVRKYLRNLFLQVQKLGSFPSLVLFARLASICLTLTYGNSQALPVPQRLQMTSTKQMNGWILRSWSWHLQGTLLHGAKWLVWHIHHSFHLYLHANLNALVMNLTRCPESKLFHDLCSIWCLKEIICSKQVYALCILKKSWSHPKFRRVVLHTASFPRFRLRWVWGGIRLSQMSRWALQNGLNRIRFRRLQSIKTCRDRFTLKNLSMRIWTKHYPLVKTNMAGWKMDPDWRCITYWKWRIFHCQPC